MAIEFINLNSEHYIINVVDTNLPIKMYVVDLYLLEH